jgi:CDGSH-type Zn-finger protein
MPTDESPAAIVTFYPDGPILLRGDFVLRTPQGEVIDPRRGTVALCRCGRSGIKPFCDGSHKLSRFRAPAGVESSVDDHRADHRADRRAGTGRSADRDSHR